MADLLSAGAGAAEGLDRYLTRLLAQEKLGEEVRSNKAEEGLKSRGLDQNDWLKDSLAGEHQANIDAKSAALLDEQNRRGEEDKLLADPNTSPVIRNFLSLRRVVPKGENVPVQLFEPGMGKTGDIKETPNGFVRIGADNSVTPITDANKKPVQGRHEPPIQIVPSGEGFARVPKAGGAATPVMGADGKPLPPATTSSTRTMMEGAKMLAPHIPQITSEATALDKVGLFGPFMGRVRELATKLGTVQGLGSEDLDTQQRAMQQLGEAVSSDPSMANDELSGEFATDLGLLMTGAARVHGGSRGGGSPMMLEHFKGILGGSSTLPLFRGRMRSLGKFIGGYAAGPGGAGQAEGGGSDAGLPQVGGTFQGGKVLKVTPIP